MKKILLSIMILAVMGITAKVQAQCELQGIANVTVQVVGLPVPIGGGKCKYTVNIAFDMEYNAGAKYVYATSFLKADYDALAISNPLSWTCGGATPSRDMPTSGRLGVAVDQVGKSFLDIGFDLSSARPVSGGPVLPVTMITSYPADPTVVLIQNTVPGPGYQAGLTVTRQFVSIGIDKFKVYNIEVILNQACGGPVAINTDVYGSNANGAVKAQCYLCGVRQFFNDPSVIGFKNCNNPRQYSINITTVDPTPKNITYKVYLDKNSNGVIDGGDQLAFTSGTISLSSGSPYAPGLQTLPPPYSTLDIWNYEYIILVEGPTLSNSIVKAYAAANCAPLPVSFKTFTATRNKANVITKWETSTEINNSGFAVERNIKGDWEQVAFVPSQAAGGNSTSELSYQFIDPNNAKGISQYRIRQVDIDNKSKYTEIRSVKGDGQIGKIIVYPNPTADGRVNVVFDDASVVRSISVSDMSGRTIKQINGISNNNITIDNLQPGIYSLRVFVPETGEQTVQKIVVNKR